MNIRVPAKKEERTHLEQVRRPRAELLVPRRVAQRGQQRGHALGQPGVADALGVVQRLEHRLQGVQGLAHHAWGGEGSEGGEGRVGGGKRWGRYAWPTTPGVGGWVGEGWVWRWVGGVQSGAQGEHSGAMLPAGPTPPGGRGVEGGCRGSTVGHGAGSTAPAAAGRRLSRAHPVTRRLPPP